MNTIGRAVIIVFLGLVFGLVHSYCAPLKLQPDNNPEPPPPADSGAPRETTPPAPPPGDSPPGDPVPEGDGHPLTREDPKPPPAPPAEAKPNYYITVDKAKEYFDKGLAQNVVFVDARPIQNYSAGHVKGAMHLPPQAFEGVPRKATENLPGMTVVVYCHGATCTDSKAVMIGLQNLKRDIGPIFIMEDGIDAWRAKFPALIEAGPDPFGP